MRHRTRAGRARAHLHCAGGTALRGHPTLGTAFALRGQSGAQQITLELNVGKVPVHFEDNAGEPVFGEMTQIDPTFGIQHDREAVAGVTGLRVQDFDDASAHRNCLHRNSLHCDAAQVAGRNSSFADRLSRRCPVSGKNWRQIFLFRHRETVDRGARLHARMFFYNGEDPATGSAAGCSAAWMVAHGVAKPDERVLIEQGVEMNRPSRIFVRASQHDNRVVNVRVGGQSVEIMRGEVFPLMGHTQALQNHNFHNVVKIAIAKLSHLLRRYFTALIVSR